MGDFRRITDDFWASPQIAPADVEIARKLGVRMIVNNRPDGEEPGQVCGSAIEAATEAAGIAYRAIPVTHAGIDRQQVAQMAAALAEAGGPVLAFCRSGTRSTLLWALAQAAGGSDPELLTEAAAAAGYDLSPVRAGMDMLAAAAPQ